ncbi:restriction endonuclease subunit S [Streptomyces sp. NPDC008313]|uniref:restriction endonuclease subunit S n=1 Tax=Streptomyces sp. NPDC008313 TaxID=3364826 RepID=UPI0036E2266C
MSDSETREVALKWVLNLRSGTSCDERVDNGRFPVMGASGSIGRTNRANTKAGSAIIGRVGTVGAVNRTTTDCWASDNAIVATPGPSLTSPYMFYLLLGARLPELASKTAQPLLTATSIGDQRFVIPGLAEQRRISDFLDTETARIDQLIQLYGKLATLTNERSQRVVDEAVDRGEKSVPLRYVIRFREGPGIMATDFHTSGVPLIRIAGLKQGKVSLNGCNFLDPEKVAHQWPHFRLRIGDRLISGSATMGGVSVVNDPTVVGAIPYTGLIILRPAHANVCMEYIEAFLQSSLFSRQINLLKTGATMQHFGPTHLSQVRVPMPPLNRQQSAAAIAREALSHAFHCKELTKRQIALLKERRQALITAAVTGQLDVSTASGRNVTEGVFA